MMFNDKSITEGRKTKWVKGRKRINDVDLFDIFAFSACQRWIMFSDNNKKIANEYCVGTLAQYVGALYYRYMTVFLTEALHQYQTSVYYS